MEGAGITSPFDIAVKMDPENGDCALFIEGERFELWQVLHRALDHLFFGLVEVDYA